MTSFIINCPLKTKSVDIRVGRFTPRLYKAVSPFFLSQKALPFQISVRVASLLRHLIQTRQTSPPLDMKRETALFMSFPFLKE
jgi:hypothetical protein